MSAVAVLGGGSGGTATAAELTLAGHAVRLWNRRASTIEPLLEGAPLRCSGAVGDAEVELALATTELAAALSGAEVVVVCLPALAHRAVFDDLAAYGVDVPVVLNPGHTGGALHAARRFVLAGRAVPPIAELSTLTYVARQPGPGQVRVYSRAQEVFAAALPGGASALSAARGLFPAARVVTDVLATSLSNINLVLHPPGAVLSAAWVEATDGDFLFYADATTPAVYRVLEAFDDERRAVAAAFGHELPRLVDQMAAIGTVDRAVLARGDGAAAIRESEANGSIRAPSALTHRFYVEDFPYAVQPFLALADAARIQVPVAAALFTVAGAALGAPITGGGLDAAGLGIQGLSTDEVLAMVR